MKSKELKKIEALNQRKPATISQWLRYRDEYKTLAPTINPPEVPPAFSLGHIMPVVGKTDHLCPKGKAYLFNSKSSRFQSITDRNHVSTFRNGKWRTVASATHIVYVTSIAVFGGRKLEWLIGPSDVVRKYILPTGWHWSKDNLGIVAIDSDGIDYHPLWTDNITIEHILMGHAQNKEKRKQQIEYQLFGEKLKEQLNTTFVTLEDSKRAGNCIEGSLAFAERILHLNREDVINGSYFFKVPAIKLYDKDERAKAACLQAFLRETTISI